MIDKERSRSESSTPPSREKEIEPDLSRQKAPEAEPPAKGKRIEIDLGL